MSTVVRVEGKAVCAARAACEERAPKSTIPMNIGSTMWRRWTWGHRGARTATKQGA